MDGGVEIECFDDHRNFSLSVSWSSNGSTVLAVQERYGPLQPSSKRLGTRLASLQHNFTKSPSVRSQFA